jgi:hypothetical protein
MGTLSYEKGRFLNVASERVTQTDLFGQNVTIDQKYEKTANITATSDNFNDDNKNLRRIIEENNAVIQTETMVGLQGRQTLEMVIGIMPDSFETVVELIQGIGEMKSFNMSKTDRTNEYRELMAQMDTYRRSIESYEEMKGHGGDIRDLLLLEDKILDVQNKVQALGVNIGVFSTDNSFCTIKFSMREVEADSAEISLKFIFYCIKNAFFWTLYLYMFIFALIIGVLFGTWLILFLYAGIKEQVYRKPDDSETEDGGRGKHKK